MTTKIALLLPTRHRPSSMERLCHSVFETCNYDPNVKICFYIDDDDGASIQQAEKLKGFYKYDIDWLVGSRIIMSDMTNYLYEIAESDIVMFAGDDLIFKTNEWQNIVRDTFDKYDDKIVLVGGHDGYNNDIITHGFLHKNWVDCVGYVVPWSYTGDYADAHVFDLAKKVGRWERINIETEHIHWCNGKAPMDNVYQEKLSRCYGGPIPAQIMYKNGEQDRVRDAQKLRGIMSNDTQ